MLKHLAVATLLLGAVPASAQEAQPPRYADPAMQENPDGAGHPNAVTCRKPQQLPGSRLMAPPVCLINQQWAELRRKGQDVGPDGKVVAAEKSRSLNPSVCGPTANTVHGNPKGADMASGLSFAPVCF